MALTTKLLSCCDTDGWLDALASLRLDIFREYPYLYAGSRDSESKYLAVYQDAADACVFIVSDDGSIVGAVTGTPLHSAQQELRAPLAASRYPVDSIYYVGELLFYPAYRNRGLGQGLLKMLEARVRAFGCYRYLACATVVRPADHPRRPGDYVPIDRFLYRAGFSIMSEVVTSFIWQEIDGISRDHRMQFWLKEL